MTNKITPCLWYDTNAEEAANFYVSVFKNSEITEVSRYGEGAPMPEGTVLVVRFRLDGHEFMALNGGPEFKFTEAVSFQIDCKSQEEVDYFWNTLTSNGGETSVCGWLKDKYGLSWQVVPTILGELLQDEDQEKSNRVMQAMLQMTKIDIADLERAYRQN
jgi:predicted 3-demethylubiquinone-9 3-methyltransferase (glyoxalase superfamily)